MAAEMESQDLSVDSDILADSTDVDQNEEESLFEGCEKRLIVNFHGDGDLRKLSCEEWTCLLEYAKCTILNHRSNDVFTAYLLSESSLFVYRDKIMIKTCGKTTLLNMIPVLLDQSARMKLWPTYVNYSRANYMFPDQQPELYRKFESEVDYLNRFFDGSEAILGPLKGARWHVYVAGSLESHKRVAFDWGSNVMLSDSVLVSEGSDDSCGTPPPPLHLGSPSHSSVIRHHRWPDGCVPPLIHSPASPSRESPCARMMNGYHNHSSLEIVMYDLDKSAMECFFRDNLPSSLTAGIEDFAEREERVVNYVTKQSGVASLIRKGAIVDAFVFEPCGYSLNALHGSDYWTIHVTPEEGGSFVSFEHTSKDDDECLDFVGTINAVISLFKPDRFAICVNCMDIEKVGSLSLSISSHFRESYSKKSCSSHQFEDCYIALCANFVHNESLVFQRKVDHLKRIRDVVGRGIASYPRALIANEGRLGRDRGVSAIPLSSD